MTRAAADRPVLLVNSIAMRMPSLGQGSQFTKKIVRKLKSIAKLVKRPLPDLPHYYVMSPLAIPAYKTERQRRLSAALVRMQVRAVMKWIGMKNPDVFLTVPTAWPVVERIPHRKLLYNRSDKHSEFKEADQNLIRSLELALFEQSDHVLYVNSTLREDEREHTADNAYLLDHGVDLELFDSNRFPEEPADLANIPHPRIGFFGSLRPHLVDFELLVKVAKALPEAHLVLVGDPQASTEALRQQPNIHLLGMRPYEAVPSYGAHFDVALMPYLQNDWIRCCNPIKLKEYLALGVPVVSTDFPQARLFEPEVQIGATADAYIAEIRRALESPPATAAQLRARVADDTWDRKTRELLDLIDGTRTEDPSPLEASTSRAR